MSEELKPAARAATLIESMDKPALTAFAIATRAMLTVVWKAIEDQPRESRIKVLEALGWGLVAAALEPGEAADTIGDAIRRQAAALRCPR